MILEINFQLFYCVLNVDGVVIYIRIRIYITITTVKTEKVLITTQLDIKMIVA